jgi:hypothetical protein
VYYRYGSGLKIGEISMFKVVGIYSGGVDASTGARYVSCADQAVFRTDDVLKYGITVKNLDPGCPNKKVPGQVRASPGEIVMFVRVMKGMPTAEIHVRFVDIETGKPAKGLYVRWRKGVGGRDFDFPTSVDGMVAFAVPAPSSPSREIRDIGLSIGVPELAYRSTECYYPCSVQNSFQTEEVLRHGVTVKETAPWCPDKKALDEVEARPGEIVMFLRPFTWWEWFKRTFLFNLFQD